MPGCLPCYAGGIGVPTRPGGPLCLARPLFHLTALASMLPCLASPAEIDHIAESGQGSAKQEHGSHGWVHLMTGEYSWPTGHAVRTSHKVSDPRGASALHQLGSALQLHPYSDCINRPGWHAEYCFAPACYLWRAAGTTATPSANMHRQVRPTDCWIAGGPLYIPSLY